jgi:hypothetical protein
MPSLTLSPNIFLRHIVLFSVVSALFLEQHSLRRLCITLLLELERSIPRAAVLLAVLFPMFCYSLELEWLALQLNGRRKV